ncbi:MAG: aminodeoxychorismate lyase [Oleispira antarctica]|nr:aminodeoxychorismate lyase [Oleispira antarctica]MBQ0793538.1 aminodeoxychorismate lyase [Oleispira antarctica]
MELFFANGVLIHQNTGTGNAHKCISINDRALQYGDGVFETLRIVNGDIPMWGYHQQRLKNAQNILGLPLNDFFSQWNEFIATNLSRVESGCAKLIISRGEGPRGYKIPQPAQLNWWLSITELPDIATKEKFRLTLCRHTLSRQPTLAGLKHLNRLDQVMARSEWSEQDNIEEGIMFNLDGDVIEGTMSNIFWLKGDQLFTPDLSQEGVDGCVRRWVIAQQGHSSPVIIEKCAKLDQLLTADAVFLTNSLIGIQKVTEIDSQVITQSTKIETLATEFNRQFIHG